jgi:sulfur carrier protein ThiS adenylyltransferase
MKVKVNEIEIDIDGDASLQDVVKKFKPGSDVCIVNGFPAAPDTLLKEKDEVVLIRRGEVPSESEMEALIRARHTPGVHEKLKCGIVGIAGLGGLGSNVAISLARMGIGKLIVADFDVVEPSNLNRQQYAIRHIGMKKTEAMREVLSEVNPYTKIDTYDVFLDSSNIPEIFAPVQVLVECFDRAENKSMLIRAAAERLPRSYVIGASGVAGWGGSNEIRTVRLSENLYMVGDFQSAAGPGRGLMAPRVSIAANHQANMAVSILMGEPEI